MKFAQKTVSYIAVMFVMLSISFGSVFAAPVTPQPFVVSGVVVNSGGAGVIERFVKYLSLKSNYPLRVVYVKKYSELSRILRDNPKAVGWTCGVPYVQDSQQSGQQLVSVPLFNNKPTYSSLILSRSNRPEKTLSDFKGGVLAYSDVRSNSGFLSPKYSLHQQGIEMNDHFRLLLNAGNHEGSIEALLAGLADVAAIDEYVWVEYTRQNPDVKNQLHELERMGPFPFTPIVTGNKVPKNVIENLASALTNMNTDTEGKKILSEFHLDGFVNKRPDFFDPIKHMLQKIDIESGS